MTSPELPSYYNQTSVKIPIDRNNAVCIGSLIAAGALKNLFTSQVFFVNSLKIAQSSFYSVIRKSQTRELISCTAAKIKNYPKIARLSVNHSEIIFTVIYIGSNVLRL